MQRYKKPEIAGKFFRKLSEIKPINSEIVSRCIFKTAACVVSIAIPEYDGRWGFELNQYQVHFILLDSVTGYRSQHQKYSSLLTAM